MANICASSKSLQQALIKGFTFSSCSNQLRYASNYMPRSKFTHITRLDKLHRAQKAAARQQKLAALQRADTISISNSSSNSPGQTFTFTVVRTPGSQLPVYESAKNGGSKKITTIRKLSGDLDSLAAQLRDVLRLPEFVADKKGNKKATVAINRLTKHIVVRGWRGQEVKAWMEGVGF